MMNRLASPLVAASTYSWICLLEAEGLGSVLYVMGLEDYISDLFLSILGGLKELNELAATGVLDFIKRHGRPISYKINVANKNPNRDVWKRLGDFQHCSSGEAMGVEEMLVGKFAVAV